MPRENEMRIVRIRGYRNHIFQQFIDGEWRNLPRVTMDEDEVGELPEDFVRNTKRYMDDRLPRHNKKQPEKPKSKPVTPSQYRLKKDSPLGRRRVAAK